MNGSEFLTQTTATENFYRLSWLAYVKVVFKFLMLVSVSAGLIWWSFHKSQSMHSANLSLAAGWLLLIFGTLLFIYRIVYLRSVRLYTDAVGVWIFRGVFPWSRGYRGVKWRDMEDAMYFTGFFSWLFRSYTIRIGHRFTKTSEIVITDLAKGHKAVVHINHTHQLVLSSENASGRVSESFSG